MSVVSSRSVRDAKLARKEMLMQQLADLRARTASAAPQAAEATAPRPASGRAPAVEALDSPSPAAPPPAVSPAGRYEDEALDLWSPPSLPEALASTLARESDPDERALQLLLTLPPALQRSDAVAPRIAHLNALVNVKRDIELLRANQALVRERAELAAANAASVAALRHDEWVSGQKRIVREARMRKAIASELGVVAEALTTSVGGWEGSRRRDAVPAATASATSASAAAGSRRPAGDPRLSSVPYADCPLPVYDPLAGMTVLLDFVAGLPERAGRVQLAYAVYAGPMPVGAVACLPCGPGGAEADPYPEDERGQPRLSGGPTLTATFAGSKAIDGDGSSSVFLAMELQRVTPGGMRSLGWTALPLFRPCEGVSPDVDGDVPHSVFARAMRLPFFPPPLGSAALSLAALQALDPIPDGPTLFLRLYTAGEMGAGGKARRDAFVPSLGARARYSNVLQGGPLGEQQAPGDAPVYLRVGPFELSGAGGSSRRAAFGAEAPAAVPEEVEGRGGREVLLRGVPPPALAAGSLWSSFLGLQLFDATFDLGLGYVPGKPLRLRARLVQPRAQALAGVTVEGVSQFFAAKEDRQLAARRRPAKVTAEAAEAGAGSAFGEALDLCLSQPPSFLGGGRPGDAESAYVWTGAGVDLYSAGAVSEVPMLATLSPVPPYLCGRLGVELLATSRLLLEALDPATGAVELSASVPLSDLLREVIQEGARRAGPAPGIRALMTACISHTGLGQDQRLACTLPCSVVTSLQKGTAISGAQSLRGRLPTSTRTLPPPASAALSFRLLGSVPMLQRAAAALLEEQEPLDRPKPPLPVGVAKKEEDKPASRPPSRLPSIPSGAASTVGPSDPSAPWLRVSQPGGLPTNWPAPSPREFCTGINCVVVGARFLPDNVTVTRLTVSLVGADWEVVPDGSKCGVCRLSSPSLLCPDFDLHVAFEGGLPESPALLLMLETVEAHTKAVQMVGYGLLPLGAGWAGAALLEGCFQLPLHQLPPSRVGPPSSFSLSSSPRLPCATVLLRVLRAAPSVPSPPLPPYSARAYDSTRAVPGPEELELYPRRAEVAAPSLHDYLAHTLAEGAWKGRMPPPASVSSPWPWAPPVLDEVRAWESELFEDVAPAAFDLGYLAPYEPPAGLRVQVAAIQLGDGGAPCLPLALHTLLPGRATASPAVTASCDYEASTRRVSRFTDSPRAHPAVEWAAEKALLVEVKTVLPPLPKSALSDPVTLVQAGWTVAPLFDAAGEGYVWRGRFTLPLLQGPVPQAVVGAIAGGETASSLWQQLLGIVRPTQVALVEYGEDAAEKVRASADVLGSGVAGAKASPTEAQRKKNGALLATEAANVVASKVGGGDVSAAVGRMMSKRTIVAAAPRAAWWPGAFPPLVEPHVVGQGPWSWALSTVEVVLQDAQLPADALDAAPVRPHPCLPAALLEQWAGGPPAAPTAPLAGLIADGAVGSAAWSARCRGIEAAIRRESLRAAVAT